jgi:hypothetical protein
MPFFDNGGAGLGARTTFVRRLHSLASVPRIYEGTTPTFFSNIEIVEWVEREKVLIVMEFRPLVKIPGGEEEREYARASISRGGCTYKVYRG